MEVQGLGAAKGEAFCLAVLTHGNLLLLTVIIPIFFFKKSLL